MVARSGANTFIGAKLHATFDSYTAATTGEKLEVESLDHTENSEVLEQNPIGGGLIMQNDAQKGGTSPTVSFPKIVRYDDQGIALITQMMGNESVMNLSGGAYVHTIFESETLNQNWATLAFHTDSASIAEYKNGAVTEVTLTGNTNDYLRAQYNILASDKLITGTVNSASGLTSVTLPTNSPVAIVRSTDKVRINAQAGGALADGDVVNMTQFEARISRPQEHIDEIRNASGNGQPRGAGLFEVMLTVTLRTKLDDTWFTAFKAGTEYKADVNVTGTTIGGGNSYLIQLNLPRLKIVEEPSASISNVGENEMTVVFRSLVATAAPTGMLRVYPYFRVINTRSTVYKA